MRACRYPDVVPLEHAVDQAHERVGGRGDMAARPAVHEPDHLRDHVDEGRSRVARHAGDAREERVRKVGERGAAVDLVEPRALEARPRRVPLEVEHGPGDLPAAHDRQRLDVHRVLEEEHRLIGGGVSGHHPARARHPVREADPELLDTGVDAVPGGHHDLVVLGEHPGAARRIDLDARRMQRAAERGGRGRRHVRRGSHEQERRGHAGDEHRANLAPGGHRMEVAFDPQYSGW